MSEFDDTEEKEMEEAGMHIPYDGDEDEDEDSFEEEGETDF